MFRGDVGAGGVSKFFPTRVSGRMLLRGANLAGDVLWGYPYRDASGRLMGRTFYPDATIVCSGQLSTYTATYAGFSSGACWSPSCSQTAGALNNAWTLNYHGVGPGTPPMCYWYATDDPGDPHLITDAASGDGYILINLTFVYAGAAFQYQFQLAAWVSCGGNWLAMATWLNYGYASDGDPRGTVTGVWTPSGTPLGGCSSPTVGTVVIS